MEDILGGLEQAKDAESMQQMIQEAQRKASASRFCQALGLTGKSDGRLLLSAILIARFSQEMFGSDPSEDERTVISKASSADKLLYGFWKGTVSQETVKSELSLFFAAFSAWQSKDKPLLVDALIDQYNGLERTLEAVREGGTEAEAEWMPHVREMQSEIREKVKVVGGREAEWRLLQETSVVGELQSAVNVPVIAIVHELCVDRHFDLVELIQRYGEMEVPSITLQSKEDILPLMSRLRNSLLPVIPRGTRSELEGHLRDEVIGEQVSSGRFDLRNYLSIAIKIVAGSCAPVRDNDVERLKNEFSRIKSPTADLKDYNSMFNELLRVIDLMRIDYMAYGLIKERPSLLSTIVEYEQKYFEGVDMKTSRSFSLKYPDWTEWPFLEDTVEMKTMCFDMKRLTDWRLELHDIISQTAAAHLSTHPEDPRCQDLSSGVPAVLKRRLQQAFRECLSTGAVRKREQIAKDGFNSTETSSRLQELIAEIGHFFRIHISIHGKDYSFSQ